MFFTVFSNYFFGQSTLHIAHMNFFMPFQNSNFNETLTANNTFMRSFAFMYEEMFFQIIDL